MKTTQSLELWNLGVTIYVEGDNPLYRHAASLGNLVAFTERMRSRSFPETLQ